METTTRMMLKITYKNGNKIERLVHAVYSDKGNLVFMRDEQVHYSVIHTPVYVPFENIDMFEIEPCECIGWTPIKDAKN